MERFSKIGNGMYETDIKIFYFRTSLSFTPELSIVYFM